LITPWNQVFIWLQANNGGATLLDIQACKAWVGSYACLTWSFFFASKM